MVSLGVHGVPLFGRKKTKTFVFIIMRQNFKVLPIVYIMSWLHQETSAITNHSTLVPCNIFSKSLLFIRNVFLPSA